MRFVNLPHVPLWQPEDFAALLGLKAGGPEICTETERLEKIISYLDRNQLEQEVQRDIVWAKFCALYLPETVERFLDPPVSRIEPVDLVEDLQLDNAYLRMLASIQHTAYFFKYLRSQSSINGGGGKLLQTITQRLVTLGPKWSDSMLSVFPDRRSVENTKDIVARILQLLCTLLSIFVKEENQATILAPQTKFGLQRALRPWCTRYSNHFLGEVSRRALAFLGGNPRFQQDVKRVIRKDLKGWQVCAMYGCRVKINLKACGKCQTVCYCSQEHQRAHWRFPICPHKDMCHTTVY